MSAPPGPSPESFARDLLAWYDRSGRKTLPWKKGRDPYRVWVSEIMLQQTRVAAVIPYYECFIKRFPDVETLARTPLDDVLGHWAGLGYYARARNLHAAARRIVVEHDGRFPREYERVAALPGIGRSTAAAILALAFDQRHAILDGNARRVLARLHRIDRYPGERAVLKELWRLAERLTPARRVGDYTQAIMDLGAIVCARVRPRCDACPVSAHCRAWAAGDVERCPAPRPVKHRARRRAVFLVARDADGALLLQRRPPTGVWGGLWCLPEFADLDQAREWSRGALGAAPERGSLKPFTHGFTHFDLVIEPVQVEIERGAETRIADTDAIDWHTPAQANRRGLPAPIRRLLNAILLSETER